MSGDSALAFFPLAASAEKGPEKRDVFLEDAKVQATLLRWPMSKTCTVIGGTLLTFVFVSLVLMHFLASLDPSANNEFLHASKFKTNEASWQKRFKRITDSPQHYYPLSEIGFGMGEWRNAIEAAWSGQGVERLLSDEKVGTHPDLQKNINDWCKENKEMKIVPPPMEVPTKPLVRESLGQVPINVCEAQGDERWERLSKMPGMRAISVSNLERIWKFIDLLSQSTDRPGYLRNPSLSFKGCSHDSAIECEGDAKCKSLSAQSTCSKQLFVPKDKLSLYLINTYLVEPLTFFNQASFVEHVGGGVPEVFVSHSWRAPFKNFVDAANHYYDSLKLLYPTIGTGRPRTKDNTFFWVCIYGNNQHNIRQEVGGSIYGPFWYGIQIAPRGVVALQHDAEAQDFTGFRAWCVFEMAVAYFFKKDFRYLCSSGGLVDSLGYHDYGKNIGRCDPNLWAQLVAFGNGEARTSDSKEGLQNKADIDNFVHYTMCPAVNLQGGGVHCLEGVQKMFGIAMAQNERMDNKSKRKVLDADLKKDPFVGSKLLMHDPAEWTLNEVFQQAKNLQLASWHGRESRASFLHQSQPDTSASADTYDA